MTNEQINIAIAKACGWDFDAIECAEWGSRQRWCKSPHGKIVFRHGIPDYCNNLNAMHEAEKVLTIDQKLEYVEILRSFDGPVSRANSPVTWIYAHIATARQRAEAFVRTIGKWKEQN